MRRENSDGEIDRLAENAPITGLSASHLSALRTEYLDNGAEATETISKDMRLSRGAFDADTRAGERGREGS